MISVKRRQLMLLAGTTALPALMAFADENVAPSLLHLGVISDRENQPDHVLMQYSPLLDHLRQTLEAKGIAVGELRIARNTAELARFVRNRQVDIVIESMMATFRINAAEPLIKPALAAWRKGRRETRSVFFVRQNSPIKHLGELAGKTLALDSPRSTTAYTLPRIVLRQHGLVTEALATDRNAAKSVRFVLANAEINQACQVDRGRVDGCGRGEEFRVGSHVSSSGAFPGGRTRTGRAEGIGHGTGPATLPCGGITRVRFKGFLSAVPPA